MRKNTLTAILGLITTIGIAQNVRAEIASRAYVDNQDNTVIFGTASPSASDTAKTANGGVIGYVDSKTADVSELRTDVDNISSNALAASGQLMRAIAVTDDVGNIGFANQLNLSSIHLPTPGNTCGTSGCMLMYYGNDMYVWEQVARENNETISTDGAVYEGVDSFHTDGYETSANTVDGNTNSFPQYQG